MIGDCFQSVKVKKFESNSQRVALTVFWQIGCFQSIKVKKFESNSQRARAILEAFFAIFRVSKL